ncbi:hypothetical protein ACFYT4_10505 [Streptomyces sp. NPDC004609]|uniref:hypothetical protein n=1 Tax=Streptomyces sp. NPDC004609 TaxID=3364704 RepID=UPI0036A73C4F
MKSTTRASLTALMACMASAVAAAPAAAAASVPVTLPLESLETVLPLEAPGLSTGVPVPVPGAPDGPRHVTGRMLPQRVLPQVPFTSGLPRTALEVPLESPLVEGAPGLARAAVEAPDTRLTTPGASLGAPLSAPRPELFGQPEPVLPEAALLTPALAGTPAADLALH